MCHKKQSSTSLMSMVGSSSMPYWWCQWRWAWSRSADKLKLFIDGIGHDTHFVLDTNLYCDHARTDN